MAILNLGDSGEFDEYDDYSSYDGDHLGESEDESAAPSGRKRLIALVMAGVIGVTGYALAARINSSANSVEYGQGVKQATTCTAGTTITLTPYAGFVNQAQGGVFTLDSIYLENIPNACAGSDFIVRVFSDSSSTPLMVSETGTNGGSYTTQDLFRFYYKDSSTVTPVTASFADVEAATDSTTDTAGSLQITFDADRIASFANAGQVYKITLESTPH
jgi:hypothetical protein